MNPLFKSLQAVERLGEIEQCIGLKLVAHGPPKAFIGELCDILDDNHEPIMRAEVIGFNQDKVYLMPYDTAPISMGYTVRATGKCLSIPVGEALFGKVLNAFGIPIQSTHKVICNSSMPTHYKQHNVLNRLPIMQRFATGINAIDALLPMGKGQRMGLFAGSGVGKSTLLGTIAQKSTADVMVIALIGERGREVSEFITNFLDESLLKKSILVVACSDEPALTRRQAAYTATTIAEYFCQQGRDVCLLMDSITRLAMAQRDIGLNLGEPPTARGYTPSVFSLLPGLIERAGCFKEKGSITAIYTVLVEGDDFNEPIADTMRSLLDGHIVLTRELAQKGHYPAIAITESISRLQKQLLSHDEQSIVTQIVSLLSLYQQNKELIELGVYKPGSHPKLDKAVARIDSINALLTTHETHSSAQLIQSFKEILA
jgi:flagellum-specific ATP synthase